MIQYVPASLLSLLSLSLLQLVAAESHYDAEPLSEAVAAVEINSDIYDSFHVGPWKGKEKSHVPRLWVNTPGLAKVSVQQTSPKEDHYFDLIYLRDASTNELVAGAALTREDTAPIVFKYDESVKHVHVFAHSTQHGLWTEQIMGKEDSGIGDEVRPQAGFASRHNGERHYKGEL